MNLLQITLLTTFWAFARPKDLFCEECWTSTEEKALCVGDIIYEDTCVGQYPINCKRGKCRCHCKIGYFRRYDFQCVKERECYPRQLKVEQWLQTTDDVYMKWMSGYQKKWYPWKCFKSKYSRHNGNTYYRNVELGQAYGAKWITSAFCNYRKMCQLTSQPTKLSTKLRNYSLEIRLEYSKTRNEAYLKIVGEAEGKRPPNFHPPFVVLFASDYCIIVSDKYPGPNERAKCVYWTTYTFFNEEDVLCEYTFQLFCAQPNLTVSHSSECWK